MDMNVAQVHELYKLRTDVFVGEQKITDPDIDDHDIHPGTLHLLAYETDGGLHLVGCARVFGKPEDGQHIGRLVVSAEARGKGVARALMDKALEVCRERAAGIDPTHGALVKLGGQTYLRAFYESFGFEVVGEEYDEGGAPHFPFELVLR